MKQSVRRFPKRDGSTYALPSKVRMTKNHLIDHVTEATQGTKKDTERVIDAILTSITETLVQGEKVDLRGFGSFRWVGRRNAKAENPKTGEPLTIAARNVTVFKPSKELSGRLNGTSGDVNTDSV